MRVYDPIRQRFVTATPEELVRQELLRRMIHLLGYPKGLIAVEKEFASLGRRADLVCYQKHFSPLLVVECKRGECTADAREQVLGYNSALGAPFVCIAGQKETFTFWFEQGELIRVPFLPSYRDLCKFI